MRRLIEKAGGKLDHSLYAQSATHVGSLSREVCTQIKIRIMLSKKKISEFFLCPKLLFLWCNLHVLMTHTTPYTLNQSTNVPLLTHAKKVHHDIRWLWNTNATVNWAAQKSYCIHFSTYSNKQLLVSVWGLTSYNAPCVIRD